MPTDDEYKGEERRESQRTTKALVVRMRFPRLEDFRYRYTRDISRGGVFIQTLTPKPMGAQVIIILEPQGGEAVSIKGEVVTSLGPEDATARQLLPGMGIRFVDLDTDKRRAIEAIIEQWDAAERTASGAAPLDLPAREALPATTEDSAPGAVVIPINRGPARGSPSDIARIAAESREYLARIETESYYALLGVGTDASFAEIRRAFLLLTKRFHPDNYFRRAPEALARDLEDIYNQLSQAYETLAQRDRRQAYDVAIGNLGGNKDGVSAEDMSRAAAEERRRKAAPGRVSKADQLVAVAMQELAAGQKGKALANLRLALAFDPENAQIKAKIDELRGKR